MAVAHDAAHPTVTVNPDGSKTVVHYDNSGNVQSTTNVVYASDGSYTSKDVLPDGSVRRVEQHDPTGKQIGAISSNSDGTISVIKPGDPPGFTSTYSKDGTTLLATKQDDVSTTGGGASRTTFYNPNGTVNRTADLTAEQYQQQVQEQFNQQLAEDVQNRSVNPGLSSLIFANPKDASTNGKQTLLDTIKGVKSVADSANPVGTPGLNNPAVTDKFLGGEHAGESIYSNDGAGQLLHGIASMYGLGGVGAGTGGGGLPGGANGLGAGGIDAGGLQTDVATAQGLRKQFSDAYNTFQPGTAPTITASQAAAPSLVSYLAQAPTSQAQAGFVSGVPQVVAPTIGRAPAAQGGVAEALTATASQAGAQRAYESAAQASEAQAGRADIYHADASQADASKAAATLLDQGPQSEWRGQQQTLAGYLNDAITGKAPSVAELQLREAEQRQEAAQLGIAAKSVGGGNTALALRTAANNIGRLNQSSAADAAILRAKEIADARGQLGTVSDSARSSDISVAGQNAGLSTDVSKLNAGLATDVSKTNAGLETNVSQGNAALATDVSKANAGMITDVSQGNANRATNVSQSNAALATDVSQGNANRFTDVSKTNAGLATDVSKTNATLGTNTSISNANNSTSASIANSNNITSLLAKQAELEYSASHDNAGNALSASETNAKLATDTSLANALAQNTATLQTQRLSESSSEANAKNQLDTTLSNTKYLNDASTNNASNTLTQRAIDEKARQDAASNSLTASGQSIQGGSALVDAQAKALAAQRQGLAALGSSLAWLSGSGKTPTTTTSPPPTAPPPAQSDYGDGVDDGSGYSDRRLKTDVTPGDADAQALLDHLSAKSFRYKDGGQRPGERPGRVTGVMAQDVESSPAGKPMVRDTPRGKKLDAGMGIGTVMAALATLNKRLNKMEGRRNV